jgi:hypothetical protein
MVWRTITFAAAILGTFVLTVPIKAQSGHDLPNEPGLGVDVRARKPIVEEFEYADPNAERAALGPEVAEEPAEKEIRECLERADEYVAERDRERAAERDRERAAERDRERAAERAPERAASDQQMPDRGEMPAGEHLIPDEWEKHAALRTASRHGAVKKPGAANRLGAIAEILDYALEVFLDLDDDTPFLFLGRSRRRRSRWRRSPLP